MFDNMKVVYLDSPIDSSYYGYLDDFIDRLVSFREQHKGHKIFLDLSAVEEYGDPTVSWSLCYKRPKTEEEIAQEKQQLSKRNEQLKRFYLEELQRLEKEKV